MRAVLLLSPGLLLLVAVGCGPDPRVKAELATLQGKWLVVNSDGRIDPHTHYVIHDDGVRMVSVDSVGTKVELERFKLRIKPGHTPAQVDLVNVGPNGEDISTWQRTGRPSTTGRRRGPLVKVEPLTASIYKLDGDTLTLCVGSGKDNRPTTFDLDSHPRSLVLKRAAAGE